MRAQANVLKLMKQTDGSCQIMVLSLRRVRLAGFETINGQWVAETEKPAEDRDFHFG